MQLYRGNGEVARIFSRFETNNQGARDRYMCVKYTGLILHYYKLVICADSELVRKIYCWALLTLSLDRSTQSVILKEAPESRAHDLDGVSSTTSSDYIIKIQVIA